MDIYIVSPGVTSLHVIVPTRSAFPRTSFRLQSSLQQSDQVAICDLFYFVVLGRHWLTIAVEPQQPMIELASEVAATAET